MSTQTSTIEASVDITSSTSDTTMNVTTFTTETIMETDEYNITINESTSTELYTTTFIPEICSPDIFNGIDVIDRNASMFIAIITYNCSLISSSDLFIFINETEIDNCNITEQFSNNTINIICNNIENNAGRNWTFTIGSKDSQNQIFLNETFTITLEPLSLQLFANISITVDANLTSAFIHIPNCHDITDLQYLIFRCNSSDISNNTLSKDCTYTCLNLIPGSNYTASFVRLPIPIADKGENNDNNTFEEETLTEIYITDLDKILNLTYQINNKTLLISFNRPRGNFDQINITCSAQDQICSKISNISTNTTTNCLTCTSILISSIEIGVRYKCQAMTVKQDFDSILSNELDIFTPLQPVSDKTCEQDRIFETSHFELDIFPQTDYLEPPIANITAIPKSSRSVIINWTVGDQSVYIKSFEVIRNISSVIHNIPSTSRTYTVSDLLPNTVYKFRVQLNANIHSVSELETVKTLESEPKRPLDIEIENKIVCNNDDILSTPTQHVIEIDPTLFTDEYGVISNYSFYIRQDHNKDSSQPDLNKTGTYAASLKNSSIDYLAIFLQRSSFKNHLLEIHYFCFSVSTVSKIDNKVRLIIGNETCNDESTASIPCNGKLKSNTNYSLIVSACTKPGCTSVVSKIFQTKIENPVNEPSSWKLWLGIGIAVPAIVIIVGAVIWNRRKSNRRLKDFPTDSKESDDGIQLRPIHKQIKPKPLHAYINMRDEDAINEFHDLKKRTASDYQPDCEPRYSKYNRYPDIPARGPWESTAIRLSAVYRSHDYINANEIRSYDNKKRYIACQAPMETTCQDFWDMIIEYNVSKIVMLTEMEEPVRNNPSKFKPKCYPYFYGDKGETLEFDYIYVTVLNVEYYRDTNLEIRYLRIEQNNIYTKHYVMHYYFTGWADFGAVEPTKLLDLIETINNHGHGHGHGHSRIRNDPLTPIVVHCSAGVGRTGTYIAVDTIIRLLDRPCHELRTMKLDIMSIVYELRKDRIGMVQSDKQYLLINRCVEEILRRTRRLDSVLNKPENVYGPEYENVSTLPFHPYVNIDHPSSNSNENHTHVKKTINKRAERSSIPPSPHYTTEPDQRPPMQRLLTQGPPSHTRSNHSSTHTRRSTHTSLHDSHHSGTHNHNHRDDEHPPQIPPRRSTNRTHSEDF
ncbi:unnamed protein product [Adineta steineri]|uniref:Protein-tyrosine-phosphatase n=1 Tax=Adineta steineri TaxID=433720 RepID=A0A813WZS4_9BILA|nr:unnamed protein product [Adineta steineri]